jgi:SAM-dependent methyltransferase
MPNNFRPSGAASEVSAAGTSPLSVWAAGMEIGLRTIRREPLFGLKRLLLPVSYWRTVEFGYVLRNLTLPPGAKVLDLGSPKELSMILARRRGYQVVATDILAEEVERARRMCDAQGFTGTGWGQVRCEVVDGRTLPYADDTFDAAVSVSVLEHIPESGDERTVSELIRVIKPGARLVATVPFATEAYDTHVHSDVYERQYTGEPQFFERHYDQRTLDSRLVGPSRGELGGLEIWGEHRVRVEKALFRFPAIRMALSPVEPLLAAAFLRAEGGPRFHPMAAFFWLKKPAA